MERKNVQDKRVVRLDHVLDKSYIPYGSGRPARETAIGEEDMMNLRIALETSKSLEEFLLRV